MLKLLSIAIGFYVLYRLVNNSGNLESGEQNRPLDEEDQDGDFIDYEEVD